MENDPNLISSYEEIRAQFPYRNFSDNFWRRKARQDFGIEKNLFNLFHVLHMSSEERYLQLGLNFGQIRHKFKFHSPFIQLVKAAEDHSPEQFEELRNKLRIDLKASQQTNLKLASVALNKENVHLYNFLDPRSQIMERETSSRIGSCQSREAQHFFHLLLISQPDNLEVFQTDLFSLRRENMSLNYIKICTLSLDSKFEQKIQANLAMIERTFPESQGQCFRGPIIIKMLAFPRYSDLTDKFMAGFPYDFHKESQGRTLQYPHLMKSVLRSLDVKKIEFFLSKGVLFQANDFLGLIKADNSRLFEKITILKTYFQPAETRCMFYGYSGAYAQWKTSKDGWGGSKEILRVMKEFLLADQLDLFWTVCTSFEDLTLEIPYDFVTKTLEKGHHLTARSLFRILGTPEEKRQFVEDLEPNVALALDFDFELGY